jgi:autotransporter-associated beta strand protein
MSQVDLFSCRNLSHFLRAVAVMAALSLFAAKANAAFTIIPQYDTTVTSSSDASNFETSFQAACNILSANFSSNITIYLKVTYDGTFFGADAGPSSYYGVSYPTLLTAMSNNTLSPDQATAVANLSNFGAPTSATVDLSPPQALALGLRTQASYGTAAMGTVQFGGPGYATWNWSSNRTQNPNGGDFVGVALHEITHAIGRVPILGNNVYTLLDLYRYQIGANPPTRILSSATPANNMASIDGVNSLGVFATTSDISDWDSSRANDSFNAFFSTGQLLNLTTQDITLMNVLGFAPPHQTLYFNPAGNFQGSGTWDYNNTANWSNGVGNVTWSDTTGIGAAIFSGTPGPYTATVNGNVTANMLQFAATGYTVTGGTITMAGFAPSISFSGQYTATVNSSLTGANGLKLVLDYGNSTVLNLGGNNTFSGSSGVNFTNASGTVKLGSATALGTGNNLTMSASSGGSFALIELEGNNQTIGNLTGDANSYIDNGLASTASVLTVNENGNTTFAGTLRDAASAGNGTLALTISGNGVLTLVGTNTHSGATTVSRGTLQLANGGQYGTLQNSAIIVGSGGELDLGAPDALGYANSNSLTITGVVNKIDNQSETLYRPITLSGGTMTSVGSFNNSNAGAWNFFGNYIQTASSTANYIAGAGAFSLRNNNCYFNLGANSTLNISVPIIQNINSSNTPLNVQGSGTMVLSAANIYPGATNIGGGTLQISGTGSLGNGNYSASIANSGALVFNTSTAQTLGGVISGPGNLVQFGPGILTLSAVDTYYGTTTVSSGVLLLDSGTLNASPVSVANGATFGGAGSAGTVSVALGGTIQGGSLIGTGSLALGSLNYSGTGGLFFAGVGNYAAAPAVSLGSGGLSTSGAVVVTVGNLIGTPTGTYQLVGYSGTIGGGTAAIQLATLPNRATGSLSFPPGQIDLTITGTTDFLHWTGAVSTAWDTSTPNWILNSNGGTTAYLDSPGDAVVFDDGAGTNGAVTIVSSVHPSSITVSNTAVNYSFSGAPIAGVASLVKNGPGSLTLSTSNSYSGGTFLADGVLSAGAAMSLGSGPLSVSGGTLTVLAAQSVSSVTVSGGLSIINDPGALGSGPLAISGGSLDNRSGSPITLSGNNAQQWNGSFTYLGTNPLNMGNGAVALNSSPTLTVSAGTLSVGGAVSGTGSLTLNGSGMLVLTGSNTYSGGTTVSGGTLQIGNGASTFGAGPYSVSSPARLYLNYAAAVQGGTGTWSNQITGNGTLELNSAQAVNGTANWGPNSSASTVFQPGFTGTLQIDNGRLDSYPAGLGGVSNIIVKSGGQFMAWFGTYSQPVSIAGVGWGESGYPGALRLASNTAAWTGPITLTANATILSQSGASFTLAGPIGGAYQANFDAQAGATLTVSPSAAGLDTYASTEISDSGAVVAGNQYAFSTGPLVMNNGTLKLNGHNLTFANLTGAGVIQNGNAALAAQISVGTDNSSTTYGGMFANGSTMTLAVAKVGTGVLTLTGNSPLTGVMTVSAGTLRMGDGAANNGSVASNIANNAVLAFATPLGQAYGGVISGSGALTKTGTGTLYLTSNQTYTGQTLILAGTVKLGTLGSFGGNGAGYTVNSTGITSTPVTANVLKLTDGGGSEARSAFYNWRVSPTNGFTASFTYAPNSGTGTADGIVFMLQNDPRGLNALGGNGGGFGYANNNGGTPIANSAAIDFNLYNNVNQTAYDSGGVLSAATSIGGGISLHNGDPINVIVTYNAQTQVMAWSMTDASNPSLSFSTSQGGVNLQTVLSGTSAYIGFSGATGGAVSTQTISNFTYTPFVLASNILPATTTATLAAGATLDLYGGSQSLASLSGAGTMTNSNVGTIASLAVGADGTSQTFSGSLSDGNGQLAVSKVGTGVWTLTGNSPFTGGMMVSAGTLRLGDGAANNGGVTSNITNNAVAAFATPYGQAYGGVISGSGALTKTGTGTLYLTSNQTYTGQTVISAGTVKLGALGSFGGNGAGYTLNSTGITSTAVTANVLKLTDGGGNEARSAFYNWRVSPTNGFTASFTYAPNSGTGTADGITFMLQNDPRGTGSLGLGGGALGYASGTPIVNSAAIDLKLYSNVNQTAYDSGGSLSAQTSIGGGISLHNGDPINVTVTYNAQTQVLAWSMTDASNPSLKFSTSQGGVNLQNVLAGTNAYIGFSGATGGAVSTQTISNFTYTPSVPASNILPATTTTTLAAGATLDLYGVNQSLGSLSGAGTVTNSNVGTVSSLTVGADGTSQTFSGSLSNGNGQLAVVKTGAGNWTVVGAYAYSGTTTVNGGTLQLGTGVSGQDGSISNTSSVIDNAAIAFDLAGTQTAAYAISGSGSLTKVGSGRLTLSGTNTFTGGTIIAGGKLIVTNIEALADGSNLTVGNPASFASPVVPAASVSDAPAATSVPEPRALALLSSLVASAAAYRRLRRMSARRG